MNSGTPENIPEKPGSGAAESKIIQWRDKIGNINSMAQLAKNLQAVPGGKQRIV